MNAFVSGVGSPEVRGSSISEPGYPSKSLYIVKASFDSEANVWLVDHTDAPSLSTEAASFEELCRKTTTMASELREENGLEAGSAEVPIEIITRTTTRVTLPAE